MKNCMTGLFWLMTGAAPAAAQGTSPQTPQPAAPAQPVAPTPAATQQPEVQIPAWIWRFEAQRDLSAAREAIRTNSPILHVERDSAAMRAWLDEGYRRAVAMLPRVEDEKGYRFLIQFYLHGFRDGHISPLFHDGYQPGPINSRAWPGIGMTWRGGRYEVAFVAPWVTGGPAIGAELLSCDGRSPESLARGRIDLFEVNLDQALQRRRFAFRLLWDRGNPFVQTLTRCTFKGADGRGAVLAGLPAA
jgi:hypothetical protein